MIRIGFTYNQKPEPTTARPRQEAESSLADEEPPSSRRDDASRNSASPVSTGAALASPPLTGARPHPRGLLTDEFAEWDTPDTIDAVARALSAIGDVVRLEATHDLPERLRAERPDIVFNIAEGRWGMNREAHVPAICEFLGIPYSGSDPFTLSLCLHKGRAKEALAYHGIPTAAFALVRSLSDLESLRRRLPPPRRRVRGRGAAAERPLDFPLFVKPVHEGSSKGITERNFCRTLDELQSQVALLLDSYAQPVLVEEFLSGAEFTCGVLGNGNDARVLPIVALDFGALPDGALPIYGYEAKWLWDTPEHPLEIFSCPASIDPQLARRIEDVVLRTFHVLGCRDWGRIDVRLDAAGVPHVVEVNPLPGILPDAADNSCLPKAARAAGIGYDELIQSCLLVAAERQGIEMPLASRHLRRAAAIG